jgi:hypothetical protein
MGSRLIRVERERYNNKFAGTKDGADHGRPGLWKSSPERLPINRNRAELRF